MVDDDARFDFNKDSSRERSFWEVSSKGGFWQYNSGVSQCPNYQLVVLIGGELFSR